MTTYWSDKWHEDCNPQQEHEPVERPTLSYLIDKHRITSKVVGEAPPNEGFPDSNRYMMQLRRGNKRMTVPFYTGSAWTREPNTMDVLYCLLSDASGAEDGRTFEDWCGDYGYDTDSRKAEHTFQACQLTATRLKRFLGEHYQAFQEAEPE